MRSPHPRRYPKVLSAALLVTLGLSAAGCAAGAPTTTVESHKTATAQEEPAEDAALATATATLEDGTMDVIVRSLELDDNDTTMTLRVAFVPHLGGGSDARSLSAMNNYTFLHPVLLDRQNLKRYSVIKGEGPQDWLSNDDATTVDGEPLESWFVYAAPEDPITSITFTIDSWSVELADIPIGDGE